MEEEEPVDCVDAGGLLGYSTDMTPTKQCCKRLIPKTPSGYVGGAYCMLPECEIYYYGCDEQTPGIFMMCPNKDAFLLAELDCHERERFYCQDYNYPDVCTEEYEPVCGNYGFTHPNVCHACKIDEVTSYTLGECS